MLMQSDSPTASVRVEMQLSQTFEKQIAYCEGEKNHPFLEEVVSIFASYFESMGSFQNSLLMWSKFLRVQQFLFGEDNEKMITTYKKMATLAVSIGQPSTSQKYLNTAQQLIEKVQSEGGVEAERSEEEKKANLEDTSHIHFQQYLTA